MLDTSRCQSEFEALRAFAKSQGLDDRLQSRLDFLDQYANRAGCTCDQARGLNTRCVLYHDFAPHSLGFTMQRLVTPVVDPVHPPEEAWVPWFHGGLIFFEQRGADLSVRNGETPLAGWNIHT